MSTYSGEAELSEYPHLLFTALHSPEQGSQEDMEPG